MLTTQFTCTSISEKGLAAIKHFEGSVKEGALHKAYLCPAGVWTCGWGSTSGVTKDTRWTDEQANARLLQDLLAFQAEIRRNVTVKLNQNQYDSILSFTFNLGAANLKKSTLLRLLNSGDYLGAAQQFPRWDMVRINDVLTPSEGLRRRRLAEQAMFLNATYPV